MFIELGLAFLTGGGMQALFSYLLSKRKEDRLDMSQVHAAIKEDYERIRQEEKECRERVEALDQKVTQCHEDMMELKGKLIELEGRLN